MKQFIAAVSFSLLAVPGVAAEAGKPFEELDLARALPNVPEKAARAPVEERSAASGQTRSERARASSASSPFTWATGPWADNHHFIAPPN
jgi:hypothetical protein